MYKRQIFQQGTPLIYAGDEFGNSQKGNNNAWCQDNDISWLNWNLKKKNGWLWEFAVKMIELRKTVKILHPEKPFARTLSLIHISLEEKIARLDADMLANATNSGKLNDLMKEKTRAEAELEEKMDRWVYLNDLAEKIEAQK